MNSPLLPLVCMGISFKDHETRCCIFGSYALHTDPKSEAILDVCQFEDEMTRDRSPRVQVVWVLEY